MLSMPDYVSVKEAAVMLGYHPESVRDLLRAGKLAGDKKGLHWWVYRASVLAYREAVAGMDKNDPRRGT